MFLIKKIFPLFILCLFLGFDLVAQDDLEDENVEIIKNFNARLTETDMLEIAPVIPKSDGTPKPQTYDVPSRTIDVTYSPPKIRPLAMKREKPVEIYNGFARAGAGLPTAFLAEAGYSIFKDKQFDFNLHAKHHSANNNKNVENQRFSDNFIKANGNYYFNEGFAVGGRFGLETDRFHYYGYNFDEKLEGSSFAADQVVQNFRTTDLGVSIFNGVQTLGDINYGADVDFYYLQDEYAARENGFKLQLQFTKWFAGKNPLNLKVITDFNNFRDSTEQSLNNFYLQPNFTYVNDFFRFKAGLNLVSHDDEYSFFPQLEAMVPLLGSRLTAFLGTDGSLQKNTMRTMSDYNRWIGTRANLRLENTEYTDYYGGVKGTISGFEYLGRVGYKLVDSLVLYQPNYEGINRTQIPYDFVNQYDSGNIFYINGSVSAPLFKGFSVIANVNSSVYNLDTEEKAWHLPAFTFGGTVKYITLEDKFTVRTGVYLENGVYYKTEAGAVEQLNGLFDVSFGAEYQFAKNIGVWVDINNLVNNKRQRFYNYPTLGINAMIGVSARF